MQQEELKELGKNNTLIFVNPGKNPDILFMMNNEEEKEK